MKGFRLDLLTNRGVNLPKAVKGDALKRRRPFSHSSSRFYLETLNLVHATDPKQPLPRSLTVSPSPKPRHPQNVFNDNDFSLAKVNQKSQIKSPTFSQRNIRCLTFGAVRCQRDSGLVFEATEPSFDHGQCLPMQSQHGGFKLQTEQVEL